MEKGTPDNVKEHSARKQMFSIFGHHPWKRLCIRVGSALVVLVMVACGGGSPPERGLLGSGSKSAAISIALTDASGAPNQRLALGAWLAATAKVVDGDGKPQGNVVVAFSLGPLVTLSPVAGAVLTDASGLAQVRMTAAPQAAGSDLITAAVTIGNTKLSASAPYVVDPKPDPNPVEALTIRLTDANGVESRVVAPGQFLLVTATLVDGLGRPLKWKVVQFSTGGRIAYLSPITGTALTNESGVAQVNLYPTGSAYAADCLTATAYLESKWIQGSACFSVTAPGVATPP